MADERRERLKDEERRIELLRKRIALYFAVGFLATLSAMLVVVKPLVGLAGGRLDLPVRDDVLFVLVVMGWATLGAFDLGDIAALLSSVQIQIRKPPPTKGGGAGGEGDGDA